MTISLAMSGLPAASPGGGLVLAADTANCNPGVNIMHSGMVKMNGQKHGAAGVIDGQDLHMCNNPALIEQSGTFAWVAVANNGFPETIVQIGIGKCRDQNVNCGDSMRYIWAWGRSPEAPGCAGKSRIIPAPQSLSGYDGLAHNYKVYHTGGFWRLYIGNTLKRSVDETYICWTPNSAQWASESWDPGDALGGSVGNKLVTDGMNYANAEDGQFFWTSFPGPYPNEACSAEPGGVRKCQITAATRFQTWTDR